MSVQYRAVNWNRQKRLYDLTLGTGVLVFLIAFVGTAFLLSPYTTAETALIRGLGASALVLLHLILSIGPLCRLNPKFLPLLYNRRHLGVTMFLLALAHATFALIQFHALGDTNPFVSLLTSNTEIRRISQFPFEWLGLLALAMLFLMAATSHDFWLSVLTPPAWKALHMLVYLAYGLLVAHVALGTLQAETSPLLATALGTGVIIVLGLHVAAGMREHRRDQTSPQTDAGWLEACGFFEIPEKRAKIAMVGGERVAVFRYDGKISCVSNVCKHQNGPLGEGRIIDGCITCPWHGYQYRPEDGRSPPPFNDSIPTFDVELRGDRVWIRETPNPPGTRVEPAVLSHPGES